MAKLTWRGLAWLLVGVVLVLAATGDAAPIFGADGGGVAAVGADDDDDTVADQLQDALSRLKQLSQGEPRAAPAPAPHGSRSDNTPEGRPSDNRFAGREQQQQQQQEQQATDEESNFADQTDRSDSHNGEHSSRQEQSSASKPSRQGDVATSNDKKTARKLEQNSYAHSRFAWEATDDERSRQEKERLSQTVHASARGAGGGGGGRWWQWRGL